MEYFVAVGEPVYTYIYVSKMNKEKKKPTCLSVLSSSLQNMAVVRWYGGNVTAIVAQVHMWEMLCVWCATHIVHSFIMEDKCTIYKKVSLEKEQKNKKKRLTYGFTTQLALFSLTWCQLRLGQAGCWCRQRQAAVMWHCWYHIRSHSYHFWHSHKHMTPMVCAWLV